MSEWPGVTRIIAAVEPQRFRYPDDGGIARAYGHELHQAVAEHKPRTVKKDFDAYAWIMGEAKGVVMAKELTVESRRLGFRGRLDLVAELGIKWRRAWLLDVKSGSVTRTAALQVNMYDYAMAEMGARADRLGVLNVANGRARIIEVTRNWGWVIDTMRQFAARRTYEQVRSSG